MDKNNQKINCKIESCLFQNSDLSLCELEEINIGYANLDEIAYDSLETSCKSFLSKDNEEFALEYYFKE